MVDYLKIAWRNLLRNKVRTFISILAITVVVMIVVFSRGLIQGFTGSFSEEVINNTSGHVRVVNEGYRVREVLRSLDYPVDGFHNQGLEHMIHNLETINLVEHILPRLQFGAMFSAAGDMHTILGVGIDSQREEQQGTISGDITAGRMPESGDEILVGRGLLEKMDGEVGGKVTLMYSDAFHSFRGRTFRIVGVRESGFTMIDDNLFYLPLERAQYILDMDDQATEILIFGPTRAKAEELKNEITSLFDEFDQEDRYAVIHWLEADKFLALMEEFDTIYDLMYLGFILLGAVILISTMNLIVRERKTEIGMMSALGLRGRDIMKIFTFEGVFMGLIGSFLGTIGGGSAELLSFTGRNSCSGSGRTG